MLFPGRYTLLIDSCVCYQRDTLLNKLDPYNNTSCYSLNINYDMQTIFETQTSKNQNQAHENTQKNRKLQIEGFPIDMKDEVLNKINEKVRLGCCGGCIWQTADM